VILGEAHQSFAQAAMSFNAGVNASHACSFVCWRAEYRSDKESAKVTGPEGLISVFERFVPDEDHGSETHPPLSKRIQRLEEMLPNDENNQDD
jgi:Zn-dependent protease with chaperone function